MPFTPRYDSRFILPVVNNLLAVITRDMQEALELVTGAADYPDFVDRQKSRRWDMKFPFVAVFGSRSRFETGPEGLVSAAHEILIEVALIGDVAAELTTRLQQYVTAVDWVVRSASDEDMSAGLSATGFAHVIWDVTGHDYDLIRTARNQNQQYVQAATLTVAYGTAEE
jgi:hypothetical protein